MRIVNAPGRFDTSPQSLAADVARWTTLPGSVAVFTTEDADEARGAVIAKAAGKGWTTTRKQGHGAFLGVGECAVLTKDSHYVKIHAQAWFKVWDGGGKGRLAHAIYAPAVVAETATGHIDVLTGCHTPAHVEGKWARIPLPVRIKAKVLLRRGRKPIQDYLTVVHSWREQTMRLAAQYHADDVIAAPDGNLDAHKAWVGQLLSRAWPGMHLAATKAPDLGKRTVGWVLTTMTPGPSHVEKARSSDHDAGVYTLARVNPTPAHKPVPKVAPPSPFAKCAYNGALMDNKTKTAVQLGEKRLGYTLTILQGCYHPGVSQSAGTHDGGQVIDFAPFDFAHKVKVFRDLGWFIWHRLAIPGVWPEHIHGGIRNGGTLSLAAAAQQVDYDGSPPRDGLADHAVDNTYHPRPPVNFDYVSAWHEING